MIDFQKAQKAFKEYLKQYDLEDGSVNLKVVHTYGVVDKSEIDRFEAIPSSILGT